MLKITKAALSAFLGALLLFAAAGCQYNSSAVVDPMLSIETQKGSGVSLVSICYYYDDNVKGEENTLASCSVDELKNYADMKDAEDNSMFTFYKDSSLYQKLTEDDLSKLKNGGKVYVSYDDVEKYQKYIKEQKKDTESSSIDDSTTYTVYDPYADNEFDERMYTTGSIVKLIFLQDGLKEGTDYKIDGITITLTYSGHQKMHATSSETGGGSGSSSIDDSTTYTVYDSYDTSGYISGSRDGSEVKQIISTCGLEEDTDYTINGTTINITYSGHQKVQKIIDKYSGSGN